jgi:hypothetical protein
VTKKKHEARVALANASDSLVKEIWDTNMWNWRDAPIGNCPEGIVDELERRCPGHSREAYQEAFARSIFHNR